jgi:hypothetical protein
MALPSSGNLALSQIKTEWTGPNNLRSYLKGAGYVTTNDTAPNVPSSGNITMRTNFLGAAKVTPYAAGPWTQRAMPGGVATGSNLYQCCYHSTTGHWYLAFRNTTTSINEIWRSSNGVDWTKVTTPVTNVYCSKLVSFAGLLMYFCESGSSYYTSADGGTSWTTRSNPLGTATAGSVKFDATATTLIYSRRGVNNAYYAWTTNGTTWTTPSCGYTPFWCLAVDPQTGYGRSLRYTQITASYSASPGLASPTWTAIPTLPYTPLGQSGGGYAVMAAGGGRVIAYNTPNDYSAKYMLANPASSSSWTWSASPAGEINQPAVFQYVNGVFIWGGTYTNTYSVSTDGGNWTQYSWGNGGMTFGWLDDPTILSPGPGNAILAVANTGYYYTCGI